LEILFGGKGMTKKDHQRNLKRIEKAIEESNVQLRKAGLRVEMLPAQIQTNQKNVQSRPRATN
jgi:flagellar motor switch protein FliM